MMKLDWTRFHQAHVWQQLIMTDKFTPSSLADIVTASGHIGYSWDLHDNKLVWVGPWQDLFGEENTPPYNAETLAEAVLPDDHYLVFNNSASSFDREYRICRPDGQILWVTEHGATDYVNGRPVRKCGLLRIIQGPQRRIYPTSIATYERDPLTGRFNRAGLLRHMTDLRENKTVHLESSCLVVGIDNMAFVNEAVGMKSADTILCSVADRISNLCPIKAIVGRSGGDTFGVILPGLARETEALAARILQSFRERPVITSAAAINITVSIGCLRFNSVDMDPREIMIRTEQALREARQRGRNKFVEYMDSPARSQENRSVLEITERVKQALKNNRLKLAFQPIIETETGKPACYEALARMFREDGSIMPAAEFIPIVEQQGMAIEFDRHVMNMAIRELEEQEDLTLAVNISGVTAAQNDWPEYMQQLLAAKPGVARRMIVEITETAAIMDVSETKRLVDTLNALGSCVSLDDFGAGFTSIRHLRTLSFAIMKIDRELLLNIVGNGEQQHLVRMLIQLARGLGMKTVAEGIETEEMAQWLRQEKVDMMQGYYFGKPTIEPPWRDRKNAQTQEGRSPSFFNGPPPALPASAARETAALACAIGRAQKA